MIIMNADDALNLGIMLFWVSIFLLLFSIFTNLGDEGKANKKKGTNLFVKLDTKYDEKSQ